MERGGKEVGSKGQEMDGKGGFVGTRERSSGDAETEDEMKCVVMLRRKMGKRGKEGE